MSHFLKNTSSWVVAVLGIMGLTLLAACDQDQEESPTQFEEQDQQQETQTIPQPSEQEEQGE